MKHTARQMISMISLILFILSSLPVVASNSPTPTLTILAISDIHLNTHKKTPMELFPDKVNWNNDLDVTTFNKLIQAINTKVKSLPHQPDLILFTGDMVGHDSDAHHRQSFVIDSSQYVLRTLHNTFPDQPFITIFGNNDSPQTDYGKYYDNKFSTEKIAQAINIPSTFLSTNVICKRNNNKHSSPPPCLMRQFQEQGYFSMRLRNGLLLIGLNSVAFSPKHTEERQSAQAQMHFLSDELEFAKKTHQRVIIAMHIPVGQNFYNGKQFWRDTYKKQFLHILSNYQNQIVGIFSGHTHEDQLQIINLPHRTIGQYYTPALSTTHGNSPGFKIIQLNFKNGEWALNDLSTFYPMKEKNLISFKKYYSFSKKYCSHQEDPNNIDTCLPSITPEETLPQYTVNNPNYTIKKINHPGFFTINTAEQ